MNKTQQKEIVGRVKAKLEKNGGRIVLTAKQLGVTSVTLNSLIHGLRVYTKSWATFAKGVGLSSYIDEPKSGVRKAISKAAKASTKKAKPAKKVAPKKTASKRRKSTTPKAKALASIAKAVSSLRGGKKAMNGVTAPAVAPPPPPAPSEPPPPAPAE